MAGFRNTKRRIFGIIRAMEIYTIAHRLRMQSFVILLLSTASISFAAPVRVDVAAGESLVAVRDKVRAMSADDRARGVEIVLAPGEYILKEGLELTEADAGAVWRAEKPGTARIAGAERIPVASFAKVTDPALLARLPEEGRGKVYAADVSAYCPETIPAIKDAFFGTPPPPVVFIGGRLGSMACYPNGGGWLTFRKRVDQGKPIVGKKEKFTGGAFICGDSRIKRWDFSKGVWLNGYFTHDWYNWSVKAVSYGAENGTNDVVRIAPGAPVPYGILSGTWGRKERRFRAINLFEELDEPGEWWLDRERRVLYVVPPGGEMTDSTDVRIAFCETALVHGKGVSGLRFEGLEFAFNCARLAHFGAAKGVSFSECRFVGTAKGALSVDGTSNVVSRCEVAYSGGGGISVSGGDRKTLARSDSLVEGCRIHDFGILQRTYAGGLGISGCGVTARGTEIWNAPHLAVAFTGNEQLFESNDVHHVLMETGDAGALYTGRNWTTQGNVLRYNFIHDIGAGTTARESDDAAVSGANAMGFYFDDCDCGDEIYGNVFMNCPRGIMIGGGRDHPVRRNVFINCRLGMSIDCRGLRWRKSGRKSSKSLPALEAKALEIGYTNAVWAAKYPRLANIMNDHPCEPLYNPVEDNVFIDCASVIALREALLYNDNGVAPGILSRMAPIRNNTVIYTKGPDKVPRQEFDPRIAPGFRVLEGR